MGLRRPGADAQETANLNRGKDQRVYANAVGRNKYVHRSMVLHVGVHCFFFQAEDGIRDYKVTGVQTCALPILLGEALGVTLSGGIAGIAIALGLGLGIDAWASRSGQQLFFFSARLLVGALGFSLLDRKSTRLNSSHLVISYAVFCLKKKKNTIP